MSRTRTENDHAYLISKIPFGRENAVHMADLAAQLGVDCRTLRAWVNQARAAGHLIASGDVGYWLAESDHDLRASNRRQRRMAVSIFRAAHPGTVVLRSLERTPGVRLAEWQKDEPKQMTLFEDQANADPEDHDGKAKTDS